jgi:hypothetical protein
VAARGVHHDEVCRTADAQQAVLGQPHGCAGFTVIASSQWREPQIGCPSVDDW